MKFTTKIRSLSRKAKLAVALLTLGVVAAPFAVNAEFYPDRPAYDYNKPCNPNDNDKYDRCGSLEGPVFNSFINTPSYGDERAFVDARRSDQTAAGSYKNVLPEVTEGSREVVIRMYVHNNANQSTNASGKGIARDTKVRVDLPEADGQVLRSRGYISASNAALVEDTVDFTANKKFRVEYKPGSAIIYSNGKVNGQKLNDSIVTTGATIGHDALDGNLPGCFEYEAVVQLTVKIVPVENPNLQLVKEVKIKGEQGWKKEVTTKPGTEVQWRLGTKNISNSNLTEVNLRDQMPPHVQLVPGSVRIINSNADTVQKDAPLFGGGFGMGNYPSGGVQYVIFNTVTKDDFNGCEVRVRNQAFAKSKETPNEVKDTSDVVIKKENCNPVNPEFRCDLLKAEKTSGRTVKFTANASASGGATIQRYVFNFGDGSQPLTTTSNTATYTYPRDGSFAARVQVQFTVNNELKVAEGDQCAVAINFATTPVTPTTTKPTTPSTLPETGAGSIAAIFGSVTILSSLAYSFVLRRFA